MDPGIRLGTSRAEAVGGDPERGADLEGVANGSSGQRAVPHSSNVGGTGRVGPYHGRDFQFFRYGVAVWHDWVSADPAGSGNTNGLGAVFNRRDQTTARSGGARTKTGFHGAKPAGLSR